MATSPTSRSLKILRKDGYKAQVVEKFNPYGRVRVDLFGFIDIVAIKEGESGVTGVQTTSATNLLARYKKILEIPESKLWLETGNKIIIHGWIKKAVAGVRKTWQVNTKEVTLDDY
jgi:hypothetical protein